MVLKPGRMGFPILTAPVKEEEEEQEEEEHGLAIGAEAYTGRVVPCLVFSTTAMAL